MKLAELTTSQFVYHPIFGEGVVTDKGAISVGVMFEWNNYVILGDNTTRNFSINDLYPYPVTVIATAEYNAYKEALGEKSFKLIQSLYNPDI